MTPLPRGKCPECGYYRKLTRDHIIPQVLWKMAHFIGMEIEAEKDADQNIKLICGPCNELKGARLDTDEAKAILNQLRAKYDEWEASGNYIPAKYIRDFKLISRIRLPRTKSYV